MVPTSLGIIGTLTGKFLLVDLITVHSPGSIDISAQKMYEESQLAHAQEREMLAKRRAEEADERRRAQGKCLYHLFKSTPNLTNEWPIRAPHRCNQPRTGVRVDFLPGLLYSLLT